jgi:hypothetical protein
MHRLRKPSPSHIETLSWLADVMVDGVSTRNQHGALPTTDKKSAGATSTFTAFLSDRVERKAAVTRNYGATNEL